MDIKSLTYFVTLVESGSYTLAAQNLHISQPSLSYAIKKLENEINIKLLEKERKKVILTEIGSQFYKMVKDFLNHFKTLENNLEYLSEYGGGVISIGLIEAVKNWMPQLINIHKNTYHNQSFELHEIITLKEMQNALESNKLHLCISNHKIEDENIHCDFLYEEEFILIAKKGYFVDNKNSISIKEVANMPLIITPNKLLTHQDILKACEDGGVIPNIKYEVERFDTACSLVETGLGITFLPKSYMQNSNNSTLKQLVISDFTPSRKVYMLYNKNQTTIHSVNHFIALCKSYPKDLEL